MSGECEKCGEHCLECRCKDYDQNPKIVMKWVSVQDKLPEEMLDVLILTKEGYINLAHYANEYLPEDCWKHFFPINEDPDDNFGHSYYVRNITHWMPLPEPPK